MADIYDQHAEAFDRVSAFVILKGGEQVATVAIKFPTDGAARLYAYVHWLGTEMVRGFANGYGYDKRSAACASAARNLPAQNDTASDAATAAYNAFRSVLADDNGHEWTRRLELAGFTVLQAV